MPVSVLISKSFINRLKRINRDTVNMNAQLTRVVSEGIDGQRVIKLFDGYEYERKRFDYVNGRLRRFSMRSSTADAAMTPITQVVTAIAVAAVIAVALSQANTGALTAQTVREGLTANGINRHGNAQAQAYLAAAVQAVVQPVRGSLPAFGGITVSPTSGTDSALLDDLAYGFHKDDQSSSVLGTPGQQVLSFGANAQSDPLFDYDT